MEGRGKPTVRSDEKKMLLAGVADKIYSLNPDLLEVLPKGSEFLPYATEAGLNPQILPFNQGSEFVVGHAPTHRMVKGTDDIIRAVQNLRSKGIQSSSRTNRRLEQRRCAEEIPGNRPFRRSVGHWVVWGGVARGMALGKPSFAS